MRLALSPIATFSFSTWCSTFASPWWAPAAFTQNGRLLTRFGPFHNPQKKDRERESAYTTAPCVKVERCQSQPDWALRIRSPLSPALRLMVKGSHEEKKKAHGTPFPGSCAPSGGWTNAAIVNLNRQQDTDTGKSSAHQITSRESCLGTRPHACAEEEVRAAASSGASLHPTAAQSQDTVQQATPHRSSLKDSSLSRWKINT